MSVKKHLLAFLPSAFSKSDYSTATLRKSIRNETFQDWGMGKKVGG
jgi:hypothetical protein